MRLTRRGTGHDSALWPVLLLLLVVLVPSAGVVWMMRAAMENERLAVRQRLSDAYEVQLESVRRSIHDAWRDRLAQLERYAEKERPGRAFQLARASGVDSVVLLDAAGNVVYPNVAQAPATGPPDSAEWQQAERLEFVELKPKAAAEAYATIASAAVDPAAVAWARQSQARSLAKADDRAAAVQVLQQLRDDEEVADAHGRLIAADVELRLLDLLDRDAPEWREVAESLARRLEDYDQPMMAADQRRFLMRELHSLDARFAPRGLDAEELAAEFAAEPLEPVVAGVFQPTPLPNVWQLRSPGGRVIALVRDSSLLESLTDMLAEQTFPAGVSVVARPTGDSQESASDLVTESLSPLLPGWRLALGMSDGSTFDAAADARMAFFMWTGIVVVAITVALALLVARMLREQSRLTRLKNDLVATVSHELKTPLASIRLLVDTLLDADDVPGAPFGDQVRAREYLEMISKENARLSRLIDNFLTFSRMERGKHRFDFQPIDAATIVDEAVAAVAERFDGDTNKLCVEVEGPLPLEGDVGALSTVIVNLLDNAWKYSDEPRQVRLTARQITDRVVISVADNGIGLSPRTVRRVFDRFFQVDQHLSRSHDGCGLGLSIVKYIVDAHGGEITVVSRPGQGSTFTVSLPADVSVDLPVSATTDVAEARR